MKTIINYSCFFLIVCSVIFSCKMQSRIFGYRYVPSPPTCDTCQISNLKKSILITNDSTLIFGVVFGGLGVSTTINYSMIGNTIITDTVDINGDKSYSEYLDEIFGNKLSFSRDSIINERTKERFYSDKYLRYQNRKYGNSKSYLILGDKKRRLTFANTKRIVSGIDTTYHEIILLDKIQAEMEYGINTKNHTFKVIKK